jgi:hypothetical protein
MIALDFFLYDNRTLSPRWGRDWGLKAATGALADRADLKAAFDRYCGAMPGGQGHLRGFGEAIGGLRSPSRDGYLLCVTLESSDSFGRPSWVVFGLWCPDPAILGQVLSAGDPIASARALLGGETLPSAIEIRPAKVAAGLRRRRVSPDTVFYRFDPRSTVREVIALLLGAVHGRTTLPNVLGITAMSRMAAIARAGFDVAYCHPMDDRAERALARVLSPQESEVEEPWVLSVEPSIEPTIPQVLRRPKPRPPTRPEPRSSTFYLWLLWLSIGILIAAVVFLLVRDVPHDAPPTPLESPAPVEEEVPALGDTSVQEISVPEEPSVEAVLEEVGERLEECKELVPEDLRQSSSFMAAESIEVKPKYQEYRNRVRQAYSALIEVRDRMVKRQGNYVAYYYDEAGKGAAPATRLQKIAEILGEAPLGNEDCEVLKKAFGFEFENRDSSVRRWCNSLGRLEETAGRSLSAK